MKGLSTTVVEVNDEEDESQDAPHGTARISTLKTGAIVAAASRLDEAELVNDVLAKLNRERFNTRETFATQENELHRARLAVEETSHACDALERDLKRDKEKYEFLDHARMYTEDLLDCLEAKLPAIESLEKRLRGSIETCALRRRSAFQSIETTRRSRAADQLSTLGRSWTPPQLAINHSLLLPGEDHLALLQEIEKSRERRRESFPPVTAIVASPAGAAISEANMDGWSSDEDADAASAVASGLGVLDWNSELDREEMEIQQEAATVFVDAEDCFHELHIIYRHFLEWERRDSSTYEQSYIQMCLSTIFGPLIRLQLIGWQPLEQDSIHNISWRQALSDTRQAFSETVHETDEIVGKTRALISELNCTVVAPRLVHCISHSWDPFSLRQSSNLARLVREVCDDARSIIDKVENGDMVKSGIQELLVAVAMRLEGTADNVCIPPCVSENSSLDPVSADARRCLWRVLKFLRVVTLWIDVLDSVALQQLMGNILSGHVLPYLRLHLSVASHSWEMPLAAVESAVRSIPENWLYRNADGLLPLCSMGLCAFVSVDLIHALPAEHQERLRQWLPLG